MRFKAIYDQVNWNPDRRALRLFALAVAAALGVLGVAFGLRAQAVGVPSTVAWAAAGVLLLVGALAPRSLFWVYRFWFAVTVPVGAAVQTGLLGLFYYLILTPVGLLLRCLGRDPLHRSWDRACPSYWEPRTETLDPRRYFRPY